VRKRILMAAGAVAVVTAIAVPVLVAAAIPRPPSTQAPSGPNATASAAAARFARRRCASSFELDAQPLDGAKTPHQSRTGDLDIASS
jgi:hypothetical protein